jgi:hypothetical protein
VVKNVLAALICQGQGTPTATVVSGSGGGGMVPLQPTTQFVQQTVQSWRVTGYRLHSFSRTWPVSGVILTQAVKSWRLKLLRVSYQEYYDLIKKDLMQLDFARWETFEACCAEMTTLGHPTEDAEQICKGIQSRIEDGTLYKSRDTMEIVKKDKDIYTYGPASWEVLDPEGDFITTEAQRNFLRKLFNQVPERYRNVMDKHDDFQAGVPLLWFDGPDGRRYRSHVHEKGMMLCTKARPDDGLSRTREVRQKLLDGEYQSYSIAGRPVRYETKVEKGQKINYHYDIDPHEISYCDRAMNPVVQGKVEVIQKKELVDRFREKTKDLPKLRDLDNLEFKNNTFSGARAHKTDSKGKVLQTTGEDFMDSMITPPSIVEIKGKRYNYQDLKKPYAGYDNFDDCVAKNKDKQDAEAYCATVMRETEGDQKSEPRVALPHTIRIDPDEVYKKLLRRDKPAEPVSVDEIKKILKRSLKGEK